MRAIPRVLFLAALFFSGTAAAQDITGEWNRGDGNARVSVVRCGAAYCATNVWVRNPSAEDRVGDRLVVNVKPQNKATVQGTAYDPQRNLNISATVSLNGDSMTTSGCVGLVCRSVNWTRAK
jgi:uncharacterized protein (DUF2147 family)